MKSLAISTTKTLESYLVYNFIKHNLISELLDIQYFITKRTHFWTLQSSVQNKLYFHCLILTLHPFLRFDLALQYLKLPNWNLRHRNICFRLQTIWNGGWRTCGTLVIAVLQFPAFLSHDHASWDWCAYSAISMGRQATDIMQGLLCSLWYLFLSNAEESSELILDANSESF